MKAPPIVVKLVIWRIRILPQMCWCFALGGHYANILTNNLLAVAKVEPWATTTPLQLLYYLGVLYSTGL